MAITFGNGTALEKLPSGTMVKYRYYKGMYYHEQTPKEVSEVLSHAFRSQYRIRLYFGYTSGEDAGLDRLQENDVQGYVSRTTGELQVPLLRLTQRSLGGDPILDHCIVKVLKKDRVLYKHPQYHQPELLVRETDSTLKKEGYTHCVLANGKVHACFKSRRELTLWLKKMS